MAKFYRAISLTNTDTNDKFAAGYERELNRLEEEGYEPAPELYLHKGNHVVLVGKLKKAKNSK